MNQEKPLDLRFLAEVESPEAVSIALRRFRRRIFSTGAVVLIAAFSLLTAMAWTVLFDRTLEERIEDAPGAYVGEVYDVSGATIVLTRVGQLGSGLGLSFTVADQTSRALLDITVADAREFDESGGPGAREVHLVVPQTDSGVVDAVLWAQRACEPNADGYCVSSERIGSFQVNLKDLVPERVWKEGSRG